MMKNTLNGIILILFFACNVFAQKSSPHQPLIEHRAVDLIHEKQFIFKDLNKNQKLDVHEDWRQPLDKRVANLVSQMTVGTIEDLEVLNPMN
jgi:beta-glucosidase